MKKCIATIFILIFFAIFQACQPEENESFEPENKNIELKINGAEFQDTSTRSDKGCPSDNIQILYVTYPSTTTEADKIRIRKIYNEFYEIYKIEVSPNCFYVEKWAVNCNDYRACKRSCEANDDEDKPVIDVVGDFDDHCVGIGIGL